jgi:hypothetical protein
MPAELGVKAWTLDYTPDPMGVPDIPTATVPGAGNTYPLKHWDPALLAGLAATEFAGQAAQWRPIDAAVLTNAETGWNGNTAAHQTFIDGELAVLQQLMADDRERYLPEILGQADNAPLYWYSLLDMGGGEKPGTSGLISFCTRIGEMAALYFKHKYKRVRPSYLCPGLLPPFGPPRHPAFPSGHSLTGHLTSQLLSRIPNLGARYGNELQWLADRVAKNRERAGLHYASDSACGKLIGQAIANALIAGGIACPSLNGGGLQGGTDLWTLAVAEWP